MVETRLRPRIGFTLRLGSLDLLYWRFTQLDVVASFSGSHPDLEFIVHLRAASSWRLLFVVYIRGNPARVLVF